MGSECCGPAPPRRPRERGPACRVGGSDAGWRGGDGWAAASRDGGTAVGGAAGPRWAAVGGAAVGGAAGPCWAGPRWAGLGAGGSRGAAHAASALILVGFRLWFRSFRSTFIDLFLNYIVSYVKYCSLLYSL